MDTNRINVPISLWYKIVLIFLNILKYACFLNQSIFLRHSLKIYQVKNIGVTIRNVCNNNLFLFHFTHIYFNESKTLHIFLALSMFLNYRRGLARVPEEMPF